MVESFRLRFSCVGPRPSHSTAQVKIHMHSILQSCPSLSWRRRTQTWVVPAYWEVWPLCDRTCPQHSPVQISAKRIISCFWHCDSIQGQALSCLSKPPASLFIARRVMALVSSGTVSPVPITVPGSISQNMLFVSIEPRAVVGLLWSMQSCTATGSTSWEMPGRTGTIFENLSHKTRLSKCRTLQTSIFRHAPLCDVNILQDTNAAILTSLFVEDSVDAPIDTLNTQAFVEDQINFGCHSRTNFQGNRNSADCHPSVHVYPTTPHPLLPLSLQLPHPNNLSPLSTFQD